jgi:hypothetical protein
LIIRHPTRHRPYQYDHQPDSFGVQVTPDEIFSEFRRVPDDLTFAPERGSIEDRAEETGAQRPPA